MPVFFAGGKGAERVAIKYRVATLPSARKARSHLKIYQTCGRLIFANLFNFYMLPNRELASPQAMTEGCTHLGRGRKLTSCLLYPKSHAECRRRQRT